MQKLEILAIIPARSGSKGVPDKNIRNLGGKPLMAHSIIQALGSKLINRVIVSTDSRQYADIATAYGAEAPFLRPDRYAQDNSSDWVVFNHALKWLQRFEHYAPDICVHLRPTYPIRDISDIDNAIEMLMRNKDADAVRTIAKSPITPYKMWFIDDEKKNMIFPVMKDEEKEYWNMPRQLLAPAYMQTANVDVVWTKTITEEHSMTGQNIYGLVVEHKVDIDHETEFILAEELMNG